MTSASLAMHTQGTTQRRLNNVMGLRGRKWLTCHCAVRWRFGDAHSALQESPSAMVAMSQTCGRAGTEICSKSNPHWNRTDAKSTPQVLGCFHSFSQGNWNAWLDLPRRVCASSMQKLTRSGCRGSVRRFCCTDFACFRVFPEKTEASELTYLVGCAFRI